jgi:Tol biopolymer transport system component
MSKIFIVKFTLLNISLAVLGLSCSPIAPRQLSYIQTNDQHLDTLWFVTEDGSNNHEAFGWLGFTDRNYVWLPDGNSLYVWALESPQKSRNYILASVDDGPGPCVTCNVPDNPGWPIPSPDGRKVLVASHANSDTALYISDFDGANTYKISLEPPITLTAREPKWSPDGSEIIFPAYSIGNSLDIFKISVDGGNLTNLTVQYGDVDQFSPNWSPNGDQIALISSGDGTSIQVLSLDEMSLTSVADWTFYGEIGYPTMQYAPQWSPDGEKLLFATKAEAGDFDIFSVNADGTALTNLTNHAEGDDLNPVWSLEGDAIAFESDRDGNWEIYVMDANGANQINLSSSPETSDTNPAWRP